MDLVIEDRVAFARAARERLAARPAPRTPRALDPDPPGPRSLDLALLRMGFRPRSPRVPAPGEDPTSEAWRPL